MSFTLDSHSTLVSFTLAGVSSRRRHLNVSRPSQGSSSALVIFCFWVPAVIEDCGPSWGRRSSSSGVGSSHSPSRSGLLIIGSPYILWNLLRSCEAVAKGIQGYCS
ncbi:uncharacterized protein LOC107616675 [Arachis ipaensis]|uniref:uncharacterized protein LOC107616675 n=1 Tax=Arachis ipaensis TaxID=130454 RepID=UPI0007AFCA3E|nr:uncharacterized protein LOC107616675 [Arachis ipaensis]